MSIKTFFEHIGEWLKEHLGEASSFEQTAATAISIAEPLLDSMVTLVAGDKIAAKVQSVVDQVRTDLSNTSALLNGAQAGNADHSVAGFLGSVQTNLGTLIADADVKNSAKAEKIAGIVNLILGEVQAILAAIPANHSVPVVGAPKPSAA